MRKFLSAAAVAAALLTSSTAHAAAMLFQFDAAHSSITISQNGDRTCIAPSTGCALSASLTTPFSDLSINPGDSQTFDFAKFHVSPGFGFDNHVVVEATLAFITPNIVTTGGTASYFHTRGILFIPSLTGGSLTWDDPVQSFSLVDGSPFTVTFDDIAGIKFGGDAVARITIGVDKAAAAAVPEPGAWVLMIGGLGMAGVALRRRRTGAAAFTLG